MKRRNTSNKTSKKKTSKKKSKSAYEMSDTELLDFVANDPYIQVEYNGDTIEVPRSMVSVKTGKIKKHYRRSVDLLKAAATLIPLGYGGYKALQFGWPIAKEAWDGVKGAYTVAKDVSTVVGWVWRGGKKVFKILYIPNCFRK